MTTADESNRSWLAYSRFDVVGLVLGKQRLPHEEASSGSGVRIEKFPEGFHARVRGFIVLLMAAAVLATASGLAPVTLCM